MSEINVINAKKHFVVTTEINLFHDWILQTRTKQIYRCVWKFLCRQCALNSAQMYKSYCFVDVKNVWTGSGSWMKMMEIKVGEINAPLN